MDYFDDFLGLDSVIYSVIYKPPGFHPKYLKLCILRVWNDMVINDKIVILGWNNPLMSINAVMLHDVVDATTKHNIIKAKCGPTKITMCNFFWDRHKLSLVNLGIVILWTYIFPHRCLRNKKTHAASP